MLIVRGAFGSLLNRIKMPALLGYMAMGIIMGNLGLMNDQILDVSGELRKIALTIILLKAGLSLEVDDLRRVRRPAVLLSLLPCCMEMGAIGVAGHFILGPALVGSFLLGAVLGAVSPAVVVPRTTAMLDGEMGTRHGVPQMIIAGSSMDDIVMIVFYSPFLSMEAGGGISAKSFMNIPIPIATGILVGVLAGVAFPFIFKKALIKEPMKVVFLLGSCVVMVFLEALLSPCLGYSSLLSVIAIGVVLLKKDKAEAFKLKGRPDSLWAAGEIPLFTLVGASIKMEYALTVLPLALITISIGLAFRGIGVQLALLGAKLNAKERAFVSLSSLPKATVQAAIGGGLLGLGNKTGSQRIISAGAIVLSVAVVAILFTSPLGAIPMDTTYRKLLTRDLCQPLHAHKV